MSNTKTARRAKVALLWLVLTLVLPLAAVSVFGTKPAEAG